MHSAKGRSSVESRLSGDGRGLFGEHAFPLKSSWSANGSNGELAMLSEKESDDQDKGPRGDKGS